MQEVAFEQEKVYSNMLTLNNGLKMPQFGFGLYHVESGEPISWAIKYGYRNIDSAAYYQNEQFLGEAVRKAYQEQGLKRSDFFISTKVFNDMMGYDLTKKACEIALKNLDLEYIDLMLLHFPATEGLDPKDPKNIENRHGSWRALEELVDLGIIKSIGISNFLPHHMEDLLKVARIKPVVNQFEIHPMYYEHDTIKYCQDNGIIVQAYSPFAQFHKDLIQHPTMVKLCENKQLDPARLILLWLFSKGFAVLAKSSTESRIASNIQLNGLEEVLTQDDIQQIDELSKCPPITICWKAHDCV